MDYIFKQVIHLYVEIEGATYSKLYLCLDKRQYKAKGLQQTESTLNPRRQSASIFNISVMDFVFDA